MSVMMQSHEPCALAARNSSADANPRTPYPSEQSDSTSAVRNGSSSSLTAIKGSLDTHHPFSLGLAAHHSRAYSCGTPTRGAKLYRGVMPSFSRLPGLDHIGHADQFGQGQGTHFAHAGPTVNLHRDLAYPQIAGYLLVHLAGCYQEHHLLFACG